MHYLEGLNDAQKEAVLHSDGPLLIVAGAGAGKTKTITHRIARLIAEGTPSRAILAVTFTNKAAGEMRERVRTLVPQSSGSPLVLTFHALGVRVLREFHEEARLPRGFSIWDRDDSLRSIKRSMEALGFGDIAPRSALSAISRAKGDGIKPEEYLAEAQSFRSRAIARVWDAYEAALTQEGALDFDDLLARTLRLLETNERVRALLRERWSHITIDEYQDTNRVQYEIARTLAGERKNLCVVGDIDQNIYSWRGADIAHLLSFEKSFPGAKVVMLEQNYRSTRTILAAAADIIAKNTRRFEKNLFTENGTGEPIDVYGARNETDEAWFIARECARLIEEGTKPSQIAVLYRENFQSRAIEEAMLHSNMPYRVVGVRFFERKEVKDALSYLRFAMNPQSTGDLTRIISTPARGIGKTTLDKILAGKEDTLPPATKAKFNAFKETIAKIAHAVQTVPASEALHVCIEESGLQRLHDDGTEESRERLGNLRELVNLATRFDFEESPRGVELLLEQAALESDQDELAKEEEAVSLLTVHASKGLEFDVVFVTGLEQGLFPSQREGDAHAPPRDEEEERRLMYVAITRARHKVYLTYAFERMRFGSRDYTTPSEFLQDIDQRLMRRAGHTSLIGDDEDIIDA